MTHGAEPGEALVAKLRYQQTKIDDAPNTIFVDEEIVAIIRSQQHWVRDRIRCADGDGARRYLFIRATENRFGKRPYTDGSLQQRLSKLVGRLDLRDDDGRPIDFRRTHRFRHTRATSLLNAGVPLHVVQRYFGHLSPRMTMHYAQTLAATHEREFLRFAKITADARELAVDPRDLYDLLELDQRADRVLPNGYCMLPPRQVCERGNACLTCDKFATDASFLDEHEQQLGRLVDLVEHRQQAFIDRTGQAMSTEHVWLSSATASSGRCTRSSSASRAPSWPATPSRRRPQRRAPTPLERLIAHTATPTTSRPAADREREHAHRHAGTALRALISGTAT